jgi:glycosyltransferase involved in cell wall biosynthesis
MEGMPVAVLEAAASGIPVIASKVGGLEEMSNGGRSILLYEFGDMDTLLSGLRRLVSQSDFRQSLAQAFGSTYLPLTLLKAWLATTDTTTPS